jgi:hypothetical protein
MLLYETKLTGRRSIIMLIEDTGAELNYFVGEHHFVYFILFQIFYHSSHKQEDFLAEFQ